MGPRVFVTQAPARRDGPTGGWVEKYDLTPAGEHGTVVRLLQYGNLPKDLSSARQRLEAALVAREDPFDYGVDAVLLLGDPLAIALVISILEANRPSGGALRVLKWDRRDARYVVHSL